MLIPEAIRAVRTITLNDEPVLQWLVQWKGCSVDEATWEDAITIPSQFPDTSLEDKTSMKGGGVMIRIRLC